MNNKNILNKSLFIFVFFSIFYYSFHEFTSQATYDNSCEIVVQESKKVSSFTDTNQKNCDTHSLCISEHELHKSYLNIDNSFYVYSFISEFYSSTEKYLTQRINNILKPPAV